MLPCVLYLGAEGFHMRSGLHDQLVGSRSVGTAIGAAALEVPTVLLEEVHDLAFVSASSAPSLTLATSAAV
jgi:hypothetical protein